MNMTHKIEGKTVFITGASSGIGAALAEEYAKKGADLVLLGRREKRLREVAANLRTIYKCSVLPLICDVRKPEDLQSAAEKARQAFGKIDVVVANAGFGVAGYFEKLTPDDYRRQFETNIFGVLNTIYATLADLKKSKGTLVLLGSVSGYVSIPGTSPYSMSKFAIHSLAHALRPELKADGISVVLIAPGFVDSEIRKVDNQGKLHDENPDPISDALRMPTKKAARQILKAIERKRREEIITFHGKIIVFIHRHFPWVFPLLTTKGLRGRKEPG